MSVISSYVSISRIATTLERDEYALIFVDYTKTKMQPCALAALPGLDGVDPALALSPSLGTPQVQLFFDMGPTTETTTSTFSAPSPRPRAAAPADAPSMTRVAAVLERRALNDEQVKTKMKRRRIDKAALHRDVALLERGLVVFTADFELRLRAVKQRTFWDFEKPQSSRNRSKRRRKENGGIVGVVECKGERGGWRLRLWRCLATRTSFF